MNQNDNACHCVLVLVDDRLTQVFSAFDFFDQRNNTAEHGETISSRE